MFPSQNFQAIQDEISVLLTVSLFIVVVIVPWQILAASLLQAAESASNVWCSKCQVFLLNLLVAQLNGAYASVYDDMVGYARLTRGGIIAGT